METGYLRVEGVELYYQWNLFEITRKKNEKWKIETIPSKIILSIMGVIGPVRLLWKSKSNKLKGEK